MRGIACASVLSVVPTRVRGGPVRGRWRARVSVDQTVGGSTTPTCWSASLTGRRNRRRTSHDRSTNAIARVPVVPGGFDGAPWNDGHATPRLKSPPTLIEGLGDEDTLGVAPPCDRGIFLLGLLQRIAAHHRGARVSAGVTERHVVGIDRPRREGSLDYREGWADGIVGAPWTPTLLSARLIGSEWGLVWA